MSKRIGEVAGFLIPFELLTEEEKTGLVIVLASLAGVEITGQAVNLHPDQARYLADLLRKAADESEQMIGERPLSGVGE